MKQSVGKCKQINFVMFVYNSFIYLFDYFSFFKLLSFLCLLPQKLVGENFSQFQVVMSSLGRLSTPSDRRASVN